MTAIYRVADGAAPVRRKVATVKHMPYGMCYKIKLCNNHTVATTHVWYREAHIIGLIKNNPDVRIRNLQSRNLHQRRRAI